MTVRSPWARARDSLFVRLLAGALAVSLPVMIAMAALLSVRATENLLRLGASLQLRLNQ